MLKIFLDMDCVLADFDHQFKHTIDPRGVAYGSALKFDDFQDKILAHKDWWLTMPPLMDAHHLVAYVKKLKAEVHILSAAPKWDPDAKRQKTEWVAHHYQIPERNVNVVSRADKKHYAKTDGNPNILIDDYHKNVREWEVAGGIGIWHKSAAESIRQLKHLGL